MENCLDVPGPVLETMLTVAMEFLEQEEYLEKIGRINWMNPREAGPAWQEVMACFKSVATNAHLPRPKAAIEKITPILVANGLMLNGKQITRQAS